MIGKLGKEVLMKLAFAKDVLSKLTTKETFSVLDRFERKIIEEEP